MVETKEPIYVNHRFYELYQVSCKEVGVTPTIRDFIVWLQEEGYEI